MLKRRLERTAHLFSFIGQGEGLWNGVWSAMASTVEAPLNLVGAGEALGISASTVLRRIQSGDLEAEKDGGRWVIYPEAIQQYRQRRRFQPQNGYARSLRRGGNTTAELSDEERAILEKHHIACN